MVPVPLPIPHIYLRQLRVVPVHQHVLRIAVLSGLGVIEAALLDRALIDDDDFIVRNGVLEINPNRDACIRDECG